MHTDVWGPAEVSSLSGSHYYVTFIDDATKKPRFIVFEINLMYLILSINGNLWLKMRQEKIKVSQIRQWR